MLLWCSLCDEFVKNTHTMEGRICCVKCGKVLCEDNLAEEATFVKGSSGESKLDGNYIRANQSYKSFSRSRILAAAKAEVNKMVDALGMSGGDSIVAPSVEYYTLAVERNFTRGRRKELVVAACLYIACRVHEKPYLLIDFSDHLKINVYVLGTVFLQLCKVLNLNEHEMVQKPVDPTLFMHTFSDRLFQKKQNASGDAVKNLTTKTALQIVASMKRDWMQTGRKPSGLCGAALYISALSYGQHCTKSEIIKIVHICEATLTKRLIEFENTESGGMTIDEFTQKAEELEREELHAKMHGAQDCGSQKKFCSHAGPPFAHGLCQDCYGKFIDITGGFSGGSEPPAFQRAEIERMRAKKTDESSCNDEEIFSDPAEHEFMREAEYDSTEPDENTSNQKWHASDDDLRESETLSDIDDIEVDFYLHNEEEKQRKKIIWEEVNKEYLEEQVAKEAAKKAYEEQFGTFPDNTKLKKEKQRKRAPPDANNEGPPKTAAEATKQFFDRKRLSKKVNLEVLEKLLDEHDLPIRLRMEMGTEFSQDADCVYSDEIDSGHARGRSPTFNKEFDLQGSGNVHSFTSEDLGSDLDDLI